MGLTTKEISSSSFNDMISSVDRRSEYVENRAGANVRLNNFLTPYTLDDKSSILNAPCGYSNGVYASLRPVQTLGSELITNGDFATDSNWAKGTGWTINGGTANGNLASGNLGQSAFTFISGKQYKVTYEVKNYVSGDIRFQLTGGATLNGNTINSNGIYTQYIKATANHTNFRFNPTSFTGSIDNVSVKEVTDADFSFTRGSAATRVTKDGLIKNVQILSGELVQNGDFEEIGSELVTNGDFDTDSYWTKYSNATISGGKAILSGGNSAISQSNLLTVDTNYVITYSVLFNNGSSSLTTNRGGSMLQATALPDTVGTHTVYVKTSSSGAPTFFISNLSNTSREIHIDNVSVKEVGQNWNFVGDTTVVNNGAKFDNTSVFSEIRQDNIITPNSKIRLTITVEDYVSGRIAFPRFGVDDGNGNPNFNINANGTYVFEDIFYSTHLSIKRSINGTDLVISNISVIEITDDTDLPRIDYTDGTGSLLLEPQSTNLYDYSQDFSQVYWNKTNATVSTSTITDPAGGQNSFKLVPDSGTGGNRSLGRNFTGLSGLHTQTVFAKKGEYNYIILRTRNAPQTGVMFDLENGTFNVNLTSAAFDSAKIEDYGDGWFRCSMTLDPSQMTVSGQIFTSFSVGITGSETNNFDGDGTSGIYIFGAQLEELSFPTSYIPTSGSTVTRNADVCNNAGSSDLINSTEGVLYAEIAALGDTTDVRGITLSDGSSNNRVYIHFSSDTNIRGQIRVGASNQAVINSTQTLTNLNKIALKYKANDFALWINGVEVGTDTSGNTYSSNTLTELSFDDGGGGNDFYGNVRSVAVFKEALTDEELAKITSVTQQEVFYEMRDRMLQINADYYEFGDYTTRLKKLF